MQMFRKHVTQMIAAQFNLRRFKIIVANPLFQRSVIEGENCHGCVKDEFVATVQN